MSAEFNRLLARALERDMPLPEALACVGGAVRSKRMRRAIRRVLSGVREGRQLDAAMEASAALFPAHYRAAVGIGLRAGNLPKVLELAAVWAGARREVWTFFRPVVAYTVAVLLVFCVVLCLVRAPTLAFDELYRDMKIALPGGTRVVFALARHFYLTITVVLMLPMLLYAVARICFRLPISSGLAYSMPVFGPVAKAVALSRFCGLAGMLIGSGERVPDALDTCARAERNPYLAKVIDSMTASIWDGMSVAATARNVEFFPRRLVCAIKAGEKRGTLPDQLGMMSEQFTGEIRRLVEPLKAASEIALTTWIGGLVGFVVIALMSPLISILQNLGSS